jgi:hypothetical protein
MKKCTDELNRQFSKDEVQMANKNMRKCSTSLAVKEMQMKTLRFHLTPFRTVIKKKQQMLAEMWGNMEM